MNRILKWGLYGLGGVAAVALLAAGGAYAASEVMIHAPQAKPVSTLVAASDPGAVVRGRQIATRQGCIDCHGANLQGRMFDDLPGVARFYAPNLTLLTAQESDADLDRAIRHGVGADGRALWIMPSAAFSHLTDAETADLVAYLRSLPPAGAPQPRVKYGPLGRLGALLGKFKSEPAVIRDGGSPPLPDFGPETAAGRSLARACVECHGPALKGGGPLNTPDLTIAAAYDPADFERLLHTGKAAGGREVGLMSVSARIRYAGLTDAEIAALHGYLKARADHEVKSAATKTLPKP